MKGQKRMHRFFVGIVLVMWSLAGVGLSEATAKADPFPEYECIKPNVAFWKDIYSKYSTRQGLIHDSRNLNIIYEVLDLEDRSRRGAGRRNKRKIKQTKRKYIDILKKLASGKSPSSSAEKRVFALFGPNPTKTAFRNARQNVRFQLGQKDKFRDGLIRSGAYLYEIKRILKKYGVPQDLAYLPHVESSFNYKAYSKFGAAGIWQFTRSTGKRFMTVDYTLDERRDPIRASYAAAKLLKENYQKLGDWSLAITAYNHGANGMAKAKRSKGGYEKIFKEYKGRLFKFASRNFYSEFLAARDVAKNYRQYFGNLRFDSPVHTREVKMAGYAPVDDLIRYFKVDLQTFRQLNPGLRQPVYRGQKYVPKGYRVRLPERGSIVKLAAAMPDSLFKPHQKRSSFYLVQRGDTAGKIARMHRIKLNDLILANQLNSRATIYVGQNLRIPKPDEKIITIAAKNKKRPVEKKQLASLNPQLTEYDFKKKADTAEVVTPQQDKQAIAPVKTAKIPKTTQTPESVVASNTVVQEKPQDVKLAMARTHEDSSNIPGKAKLRDDGSTGDNPFRLAMLSSRDRVNETALPEVSHDSQILPHVNPAVVMGHLKVERLIKTKRGPVGIIRVEAEETLGHYAEWLGVRAQDIRRLNGFRYGKAIKVDQAIKIPLKKISQERFEEQRYEYHKEIEEDFFAAFRVDGIRHYRIKRGDNIWTLCQGEFELPLWLVKKYNAEQDFSNLKPSQQLVIPVVESNS